jgi:hypothetical protein
VTEDKIKKFREEADRIYPHHSPAEREELAEHLARTHVGFHGEAVPPEKSAAVSSVGPRFATGTHHLWVQILIAGLLFILVLLFALKGHAEPPDFLNVVRHDFGLPQVVTPPALFKFDASSNLDVNCIAGCSAAASFADNAAFTAGTTAIGITGGWYSTSPTNCTSGSACAPQLTIDRKLFVQAFQGTSPWVVSGTVTTTPPANASTNLTQVAGTTLGAITTYGSSPGAVNVPSVNAFITNTPAVTLTSTTITGTVAVTESGTWTNRVVGNAGGIFDTTQNAAVPANALSVGCNFTTSPATITTGNQGAAQCNSKGELFSQITDGTTNVAVIAATTALKTDLSSVAGTATVTAAAGVVRVGIAGNANAAVDAAQASAAPANNLAIGCTFNNQTGTTGALTAGNLSSVQCDNHGLVLLDLQSEAGTAITNTPTAIGTKGAGNVVSVNSDTTSIAGTATVTAAAGVQKVGIVGNANATVDGAIGGAAPTNALWDTPNPSTASAAALTPFANAALTTSVNVKASAGNVYGVFAVNGAASVCWVQFINSAGAGTLGTGAVFSVPMPASGVISISPASMALANFGTGIAVGVSTTNNGAVACGTAGSVDVFYK